MKDDKADKPRQDEPESGPPPSPDADSGAVTGYLNPEVLRDIEGQPAAPPQPPQVEKFVRIPAGHASEHEWRVLLVNNQPHFSPLGLDICGDVFVGRAGMGIAPQLDLTEYDKPNFTVSRQHALLRPTPGGLMLMDLDSRNGTYVNGKRLDSGEAHLVTVEDFLAFGKVRFVVARIGKPDD